MDFVLAEKKISNNIGIMKLEFQMKVATRQWMANVTRKALSPSGGIYSYIRFIKSKGKIEHLFFVGSNYKKTTRDFIKK